MFIRLTFGCKTFAATGVVSSGEVQQTKNIQPVRSSSRRMIVMTRFVSVKKRFALCPKSLCYCKRWRKGDIFAAKGAWIYGPV
jgi:hypothetical protein